MAERCGHVSLRNLAVPNSLTTMLQL